MEILLIWLLTNILTRASKTLKLSGTYMAIIISVVAWTVYFLATKFYIVEWKELMVFLGGIYATSQIVYGLLKKRGVLESLWVDVKPKK